MIMPQGNFTLEASEVFVSDGAKCDAANIQELFDKGCIAWRSLIQFICVFRYYIMAGRSITYLPYAEENQFNPALPEKL